ncbi:uncharacterized protein LOC143913700 [Arctopsyche grandis]|uniref:uncharacterized protein LOC143913700 n=1 Tax=Arctopsyche grandis TaxID=121162 RepID=UPI00406D8B73
MNNLLKLTNYYDSESEEGTFPNRRKAQVKRSWIRTKQFNTAELAENYVNNLKTWKKTTTYKTSTGNKITYRCSAGQYRRSECPAGIYLFYHAESSVVSLYETKNEHSNHADTNRGLSMSARKIVCQMFDDGIKKPNAIIASFQDRGLPEPDKTKLYNFLAKLRHEKLETPTISVTDVFNWCNARMGVPVEDDKPFVLGINLVVDDLDDERQDLKFVISTKRLLQLVNKNEGFQMDATFKLTWQGYPVLIVGSSDMNQVFHPYAIAVCSNETESDFAFIFSSIKESYFKIYNTECNPKILLADASSAITDGFKAVFGLSFRRLMCYFHVAKNIDSELRGMKDKDEIRSDIECLHLCPNDETFNIVTELFLKKWNDKKDVEITTFIEYFKSVWLESNRYWYVGARNHFPITNNGLQSTNAVIKKEHTIRERLPVGQFLEVLENLIVKRWSNERDPKNSNFKPFSMKPQYSTKIWTEAYQWAKLEVKLLEDKKDNKTIFYFSSSHEKQKITAKMVDLYRTWTTFDEYKTEYSDRMWKVTVASDSNDSTSTCLCPDFAKKNVCVHSLGIFIRLGKEKVPNEAKSNLPLGQKRKRGRPIRAKKAILIL